MLELHNTDQDSEAISLAKHYAEETKIRYGDKAQQYATALNNLAALLNDTNRLVEAERLYRQALEIDEKRGADDPDVARDLSNLGELLRRTSHFIEAEPLLRRALTIDEKNLGADHPSVTVRLNNLAALLHDTGRLADAEPLYRRALAIDEKSAGPDALIVAVRLNNLALLLTDTNRPVEAESLYRRALAIEEKSLGPDHSATFLNNLAALLHDTGRLADAEPLYRQALTIDERNLGPNHHKVAVDLNNLAVLLQATNRLAEAEPLMRRALAIDEKVLGTDDPKVATNLNNLANLLEHTNRLSEAEQMIRRALAIDEGSLGPDHPQTAKDLSNLAQLLQATYRLKEAEPLMVRALAIDEKSLGPDHPTVAIDLNNLGGLLDATDRAAEAEPLYRRSLAIDEKSLGPDHPTVAANLNNLAQLLQDTNRLAEAEPLIRRALAIDEKSLGPNHPQVAVDLNNLSLLLADTNRLVEAKPLMQRAVAIDMESLTPNHPSVAIGLNNLAGLFMQQGDWASALAQYRRATDIIGKQGAMLPTDRTDLAKKSLSRNQFDFRNHLNALYLVAENVPEAEEESFRVSQWALQTVAADALRQMSTRFAAGQGELSNLVRKQQDLLRDRKIADTRLLTAVGAADARAMEQGRVAYARIEDSLDRIATQLRNKFPKYAAISNPQPLTIAATQALLRPDEVLVVILDVPSLYHQPERTFIWVVSKTSLRWVHIDLGTKALAERVQALRCGLDYDGAWIDTRCAELLKVNYSPIDNIFNRPLPFDLVRANELYRDLFGQIEDVIKDKQLLVVASGPLTQLPFQVLVTEPPKDALPFSLANYRDAAWLVRKHAVIVLPTVSSLEALRAYAKESQASEEYIGFGNPLVEGNPNSPEDAVRAELARQKRCQPSSDQRKASHDSPRGGRHSVALRNGSVMNIEDIRKEPPLPETADELCMVAHDLGVDPDSHLYIGARATEAEVKRLSNDGNLAKYKIVHFATHGILAGDFSSGSEPGLIFTPPDKASDIDDGYLSASEITGLSLDADWVILSACNTASGAEKGAEPLSGLASAFFYAGARSLLVSHWAVYSDATVKIITKAVSELKTASKIGRAEALRRSMVMLITNGEASEAHPAYWAPFALVGEGN
jgi:CHAT domain-containing protein/tetratricopeptide (TPR) repeat protein